MVILIFRKHRFILQDKPGFIEQTLKNCNKTEFLVRLSVVTEVTIAVLSFP